MIGIYQNGILMEKDFIREAANQKRNRYINIRTFFETKLWLMTME